MLLGAVAAGALFVVPADASAPSRDHEAPKAFQGPVPQADCGPGSKPESRLQGEVTLQDRESGRSKKGYRCNLELVGQYQGEGTSWQAAYYDHCGYYATRFAGGEESPGVQVIDASNAAHPKLSTALTSPAMLAPWESLKVNEKRGLLAGVHVGYLEGTAFFDVYDIKTDCAHPKLLSTYALPSNTVGHEGGWAPDGRTYYATGTNIPVLTAIDVSNPVVPKVLYSGRTGASNHGFSVSDDGNRLYLTTPIGDSSLANGLTILDVSQIQSRELVPQVATISSMGWKNGFGQHTIPITIDGHPYLIFVDESDAEAARIIDIADEEKPRVISKLKLEIHMPKYGGIRSTETANTGFFGYEAHYCGVDRFHGTQAVACGYFQSGIRVFDIRNPHRPREIAYFNPPAQTGKNEQLKGSEHAGPVAGLGVAELTADWCSALVRFYKDQLWTTCQDNGFMILRFSNNVWPLASK